MSDETLRQAERSAARTPTAEALEKLAAERERSETPVARRARLRAEREAVQAMAAQKRQRLLERAVEAELDLRAGGPGKDQAELARAEANARAAHGDLRAGCAACQRGDCQSSRHTVDTPNSGLEVLIREARADVPTRLEQAMTHVRAVAVADATAAGARHLLRAAAVRTLASCAEAPCAADKRGRGGRWVRQGDQFMRSLEDLTVGSYAHGESHDRRSTQGGAILAIRTEGDLKLACDVETRAKAGVQPAIDAYALAQAEVLRVADERERAEAGRTDALPLSCIVRPPPASQ